jgi:drug/metabolite transporter (DMT)-like permease
MYFVGIAMVLCSAAFFGTLGPVERIAMAAGVTPAGVSVVRAVFGAVVVSCYAIRRNPRALTPPFRDLWKYPAVGLFGVVFVYYFSNIAFVTIPVGLAILLFYTSSFWTVLGAVLLGKERLTPVRAAALAAGFAGVWIAVGGSAGEDLNMAGAFFAVAAGMGFSVYMLNSRYGTGKSKPFETFVQMFLWGALIMLVIAVYKREIPDFRNLSTAGRLALAHLAVFPTVLSYILVTLALRRIPSSVAAITSMSEIFFATLLAFFVLNEQPSLRAIFGGVLIVGAVLILVLERPVHPGRMGVPCAAGKKTPLQQENAEKPL